MTWPPMLARLLLAVALGACMMHFPARQVLPGPDARATPWHRAAYRMHFRLWPGIWWPIAMIFRHNDFRGNLAAPGMMCALAPVFFLLPLPRRKRPGPAASVAGCKAIAAFSLSGFLAGVGTPARFTDALPGAAVIVASLALITQATAEDGISALGWHAGTLAPVAAVLALPVG